MRAAFCTSRGAFAHLRTTPLCWWAHDVAIAIAMWEMSVTDVTNFRKITWLKSLPICRFRFSIFVLETLETLLVPWIESDLCNYFYGFQVDDRTLIRSNTHKKHFRQCLRLSLWRKGGEIQNEIMRYVCEMNDTPTCCWLKRWGELDKARLDARFSAWNLEKNSKGPFPDSSM